jgi:glycosyltransferase involved in cell wall biosynthesis
VFTGRLDGPELSEAYAAADIFAFPSVTETFGNVVLEAMASGSAVIAPDVGATTEYATRETAMQFRAGNAEALAGAILALVGDHAGRRRLQVAALGAARARTWDAVWDSLVRDYREAVAASQAERGMAALRHGVR